MRDQVEIGRAPAAEDREGVQGDFGRITDRPIADHPGRAAHPQPRHQDVAARRTAQITPAIHDQHLAGADRFDRFPLGMLGVAEGLEPIEVLAHRDIRRVTASPTKRQWAGFRGMMPFRKRLRKPRWKSCVVIVAVLARRSVANTSGASSDLSVMCGLPLCPAVHQPCRRRTPSVKLRQAKITVHSAFAGHLVAGPPSGRPL